MNTTQIDWSKLMRNTAYRYNPETCQYEHASLRIKELISYCLGVLIVSALLCSMLILVYDRLTESKSEAALRKENRALDKHQILLVNHLSAVESTLDRLKEKDRKLHETLFEETPSETNSGFPTNHKTILLADITDFNVLLKELTVKSENVYSRSLHTNMHFSKGIHISKKNQLILNSIPTLQPIANPNLDLLVSGYGTRINPFHKGKHKHPGIDFAAPRGTVVFAAATGKIADVNKSDLQAGYGNSIDIDHGHGFVTRYSHLDQIQVKAGQKITKGMIIGTVGSSGGSIAPHVHYEVILHGDAVDPMTYMMEGLDSYAYSRLTSLSKKQNQSLD